MPWAYIATPRAPELGGRINADPSLALVRGIVHLRPMVDQRRITSFLLLVFGSTWAIAGIGAYAGIRATSGLTYMFVAAACMLMPALTAIVQQRLIDRAPWSGLGLSFRGMDPKAMLWTTLIGVAFIPATLGVLHVLGDICGLDAFGHVSVTSERMLTSMAELLQRSGKGAMSSPVGNALAGVPAGVVLILGSLAAVLAASTVNLPFMLGEELGWRGYLYQATASWPAWKRVLFTGIIWGLWHAPLILMGHNYPEYPIAGIGMMVVFCTLLALLFDWSRTRTRGVWGPCLLHGIINGSAGLFALFAWEGHPLVASPVGLGGFLVLSILGVAVVVFDGAYLRGSRGALPEGPVV